MRIRRFAGRYEPRLIGPQESRLDSRDCAILADCRNEAECPLLAKDKNALANIFQALKQTGETTRACRFCLQVHNFLLMGGWSAFYRKFLRISNIKELWAMTRIPSRHSFLERKGGPPAKSWRGIVDSSLWGYRKACCCTQYFCFI